MKPDIHPRGIPYYLQVGGALMLVYAYMQDVLLSLQAMTIHKDDNGLWQVVLDHGRISRIWSLVGLAMIVGGLLFFLIGFLLKRERKRRLRKSGHWPITTDAGGGGTFARTRLTLRDLFKSFGWVGLLFFGGLLLFYLGAYQLLPESFRLSPGATALGGVSMQIAAIVAIPLYYRKSLHEIGLRGSPVHPRMLGYVLMFFIFTYAMSLATGTLGEWLGVNTNSYREQHISGELHAALNQGWFLSMLPMLATSLIAPLGEELLFRGVLQSTLTAKWGPLLGVLASAFCFALIHVDLVLFLPIFLMGILFAVLYRITGTLWAPIWMHIFNNLFASLSDLFH
ncbi:MAG TPA: CPBP family intramembrane glutamic endopeptidase [Bacilli bacterium]|nr:CPBP family intramembrane glutamic endopeptidase [Bacilli bacterium]